MCLFSNDVTLATYLKLKMQSFKKGTFMFQGQSEPALMFVDTQDSLQQMVCPSLIFFFYECPTLILVAM